MSSPGLLGRSSTLGGRIVLAGLTVAVADMTWAVLWVRLTRGAGPERVFKAVASGLLGPAAFEGGWRTALLGLTLHTIVAFGWTLLFLVALLRWPRLRAWVSTRRGAVAVGLVYGVLVWLAMDSVVLPLSRAPATPPTALWFWLQLLTHPFLVGLPIVGILAGHAPALGRVAAAPRSGSDAGQSSSPSLRT
jgi:hypothetical protein